MKNELMGIIPALVTPFDANGDINKEKFRAHTRFILSKKVHGVCLGGSTGEGYTFSPQELRRLTAATLEEVDGKVPVVAGIIANSTREVLERVTDAFGDVVLHTVISRTVKFPDASVAAEPVTTFAPDHVSAQLYRQLARELIARGAVA